ncbi:MAG: 50S ribosomal protein L32 [Firmicutes bacterium]|nr:50S ribosomal protein L32 [Bacillota bacterium]
MAVPKRRQSKAKTRSRRANWKTNAPNLGACPQCHEPKLPHRVCGNCGWYDGKKVAAGADE